MKDLLEKLGWSQAEFARKIGVSTKTVNRWSKGEPPRIVLIYLELVVKIHQMYGGLI